MCCLTFGQKKLILMNQKKNEKEVITCGKVIGVTLNGEDYKYKDWKKVADCNIGVSQNLWIVDSIGLEGLYLTNYNFNVLYRNQYDTISRFQVESIKEDNLYIDSIIPSKTGNSKLDKIIYRTFTVEEFGEKHKKVNYDDIESFTFARKNINVNDDMTLSGNVNLYGGEYHEHYGNGHDVQHGRIIHVHNCGSHVHYGGGQHLHLNLHCGNSKGAAIVLLVILPLVATGIATEIIINHVEEEVHTYYLKDWNIVIK